MVFLRRLVPLRVNNPYRVLSLWCAINLICFVLIWLGTWARQLTTRRKRTASQHTTPDKQGREIPCIAEPQRQTGDRDRAFDIRGIKSRRVDQKTNQLKTSEHQKRDFSSLCCHRLPHRGMYKETIINTLLVQQTSKFERQVYERLSCVWRKRGRCRQPCRQKTSHSHATCKTLPIFCVVCPHTQHTSCVHCLNAGTHNGDAVDQNSAHSTPHSNTRIRFK